MILQILFLYIIPLSLQIDRSGVIMRRTKLMPHQISSMKQVSAQSNVECLALCVIELGERFCCYAGIYDASAQNCTCATMSCFDPDPQPSPGSNNALVDVTSVCGNIHYSINFISLIFYYHLNTLNFPSCCCSRVSRLDGVDKVLK